MFRKNRKYLFLSYHKIVKKLHFKNDFPKKITFYDKLAHICKSNTCEKKFKSVRLNVFIFRKLWQLYQIR